MNSCAICNNEINNSNDTNEHIIPNSIGGRRKVRGFICLDCNNNAGQTWDSEISKQLNHFNILFITKRERGTPPSERVKTISGAEYIIHHEGGMSPSKPNIKTIHQDGQDKISIMARDINEARKMVNGLKRKYKSLDEELVLNQLEQKQEYLTEPLQVTMSFGGPKAGRSIVKTALALAYEAGITPSACTNALEYLQNDSKEACFGFYYSEDLILNRPIKTPLHCVSIYGNPTSGLLIAYVEYFGIQRLICCLSDNYSGEELSRTYALNPITGKEMDLVVNMKFIDKDEINKIYNLERYDENKMKEAVGLVMPLAIEISQEREETRIISEAYNNAIEKLGIDESEHPSPEQLRKLSQLIVEGVWPYISHKLKNNR
ncbi:MULTISPECIES: HNH endonuclease [unclassified Enterobacter]|uniref:HNH endonuclease n=1 Tax=unclassified Enterobacter TaxID=2608935 RepID=UPI00236700BE|nr:MULTISPECIES: HNH endonuclease [unclassified Enterobacter]